MEDSAVTHHDAQSPYTLRPSRQPSQIDSFPVWGDIGLMFKTADEDIRLKKRKGGTTYYFTATPSTLPGSCLLHSKHISSCCLLFFILLNSSNPWLITALPIFFYFWLSWILERPPLFLRRARNCLAKQRKDSSIAILQVVASSSQPHFSWDFYPRPLLSPNKHFLMMISNSHIPVGRAHFSGE